MAGEWNPGLDDPRAMEGLPPGASPLTPNGEDPGEAALKYFAARPLPQVNPVMRASADPTTRVTSAMQSAVNAAPPVVAAPSRSAQAAGAAGGAGATSSTPAAPATVALHAPQPPQPQPYQDAAQKGLSAEFGLGKELQQNAEQQGAVPEEIAQAQAKQLADEGKTVNPQDYKPSFGQRVLRGLRSAGIGLLTGGVPGALVGAMEPQDIRGGKAYNAPTDAYDQAVAGRNQQLQTDAQEVQNATDAWKRASDAMAARGKGLNDAATRMGAVVTGGAALTPKPTKAGQPMSMLVNGKPTLVTWDGEKGYLSAEPGDAFGKPVDGVVTPPPPLTKPETDAFHEWMDDPKNYEKFQRAMAAAKASVPAKNGGFMNAFAAYRLLDYATRYNPALLPQIGPQLARMLGDPNMASTLSEVPQDQPLSSATGRPIGTAMPGAPTGSTRSQAQTADRVRTEIPRIRAEINDLSSQLGPTMGRWNELVTGKIGAGDPRYEQLRTDLQFLNAAAAKFHLNSVEAVKEFNQLASAGRMTPKVLDAYLNAVSKWADTAQAQERGFGEQAPPAGGGAARTTVAPAAVFDWGKHAMPVKGN